MTDAKLAALIAKDEIRDLVLLYSRGIDRQDFALLRTLYTKDGVDDHSPYFKGPADGYVAFLERALPHMHIGGHFVCNHLISVDGDAAEGEVYAIAWHLIPDGAGGLKHDLQGVRYIDRYRREGGRWLFAHRTLRVDMKRLDAAAPHGDKPIHAEDTSYAALSARVFARVIACGPRV